MTRMSLVNDNILHTLPVLEGYKTIGPIVLYFKIGQGGMGAVYKGRHVRLGIDVAVKVLSPSQFTTNPDATEKFVQRFNREARVAAQIIHQNLVHVSDVNSQNSVFYLVMEYVDGESAAERLKRRGALPENEAVKICIDACEGLAAAHDRNIVHRDVKPDNIMIDRLGNVKVADLGLAKTITPEKTGDDDAENLTITAQVIGTPYYMSPEQTVSSKEIGPASDAWSMTVTLFQLLTGKLPWNGEDIFQVIYQLRSEPAPDIREFLPETDETLAKIISKGFERQIEDRFSNCAELGRALRRYAVKRYPEILDADVPITRNEFPQRTEVLPPPPETLTKISHLLDSGLDFSVEMEGSRVKAAPAPGSSRRLRKMADGQVALDEVIEKRFLVTGKREAFKPGGWEHEAEVLATVDGDIAVGREAESIDPEAALFRYCRAENMLDALAARNRVTGEELLWRMMTISAPELNGNALKTLSSADDFIFSEKPEEALYEYRKLDEFLSNAAKKIIEG